MMLVCEQVVGDTLLGSAVNADVVVGSDVEAMPVGAFAGLPAADDAAVLVVVDVGDAVVGVESGVVGDAGVVVVVGVVVDVSRLSLKLSRLKLRT